VRNLGFRGGAGRNHGQWCPGYLVTTG
jgi:hypothetical protein